MKKSFVKPSVEVINVCLAHDFLDVSATQTNPGDGDDWDENDSDDSGTTDKWA